jgi:ELWxxDGT repeat protein
MVKDITPGANYSYLSDFTNVDGRLFFIENYSGGKALWTSDGTEGGTIKLKNLSYDSVGVSYPPQMAAMNGCFYFFINTAGSLAELWRSNGTVAGTTAVRHFNKTDPYDNLGRLTAVGDHLYFTNDAGLWTSDGTGGGTKLVPPPTGGALSGFRDFMPVDGRLFFYAYQEEGSRAEIWGTDGTAAGTRRWTDLADPPATAIGPPPTLLGALGTQLFFTADDGIHGPELFALNTAPSGEGDFNGDGRANGNDFLAWQRSLGSSAAALGAGADGNASGYVDAGDLDAWRSAFAVLPNLPGDYNGDARIDGGDFLQWQRKLGSHDAAADGDGDGIVDDDDLGVWRTKIAGAGVAAASTSTFASVGAAVVAADEGALEELPTLIAPAVVENPSPSPSAPRPLSDLRGRGIQAADAVFAAGDFTKLFAAPSEGAMAGSRSYRPRRRF